MKKFIFLICLFLLSACGGGAQNSGLTPMPDNKDPKDSVLFEAVSAYVSSQNAPPSTTYKHVRVDLNGDGLRDGIVLFKLPHTYWCGWDGCGMAIFKASEDNFTPMAAMSGIRGPIYVPYTGNQGWRDIIIRVSGTNMRDKNVAMRFDGRSYPNSPMLAPNFDAPLSSIQKDVFFR